MLKKLKLHPNKILTKKVKKVLYAYRFLLLDSYINKEVI